MCATTDFTRAVDRVIAHKAGLPVLFGLFMGKNKTRGVKAGSGEEREQLEAACCIIANLMHYTSKRYVLIGIRVSFFTASLPVPQQECYLLCKTLLAQIDSTVLLHFISTRCMPALC